MPIVTTRTTAPPRAVVVVAVATARATRPVSPATWRVTARRATVDRHAAAAVVAAVAVVVAVAAEVRGSPTAVAEPTPFARTARTR